MCARKKTVLSDPVAAAALVCHPPLILPNIGKGEERKIQKIADAYRSIVWDIKAMNPETIVIISPHAPSYMDYIQLSSGKALYGDMSDFGDPMDNFVIYNDKPLVREIERLARAEEFPMGTKGRQKGDLDHGTMVPLYFLKELLPETKVVRISAGGLSHLDHYHAGQIVQKAAARLGRRIAVIASGDLSHCQKEGSSYGFRACGPEYDQTVMNLLKTADFEGLVSVPEKDVEEAMACGHRPLCVLAGCLDGYQPLSHVLAHSAFFGVGYGMAVFNRILPDETRRFYSSLQERQNRRTEERLEQEDAWIRLARMSIEQFVKTGTVPDLPDDLPESLYSRQGGAFVSLHEFGLLRGCIGTTEAAESCLGREIQMNAIAACSRDPRFGPVTARELNDLEISVDLLGVPEDCTADALDPARYGVIVEKDGRRGLLLPALTGIDTPKQQLAAVLEKAGLPRWTKDYALQRFEVVRHEV